MRLSLHIFMHLWLQHSRFQMLLYFCTPLLSQVRPTSSLSSRSLTFEIFWFWKGIFLDLWQLTFAFFWRKQACVQVSVLGKSITISLHLSLIFAFSTAAVEANKEPAGNSSREKMLPERHEASSPGDQWRLTVRVWELSVDDSPRLDELCLLPAVMRGRWQRRLCNAGSTSIGDFHGSALCLTFDVCVACLFRRISLFCIQLSWVLDDGMKDRKIISLENKKIDDKFLGIMYNSLRLWNSDWYLSSEINLRN